HGAGLDKAVGGGVVDLRARQVRGSVVTAGRQNPAVQQDRSRQAHARFRKPGTGLHSILGGVVQLGGRQRGAAVGTAQNQYAAIGQQGRGVLLAGRREGPIGSYAEGTG